MHKGTVQLKSPVAVHTFHWLAGRKYTRRHRFRITLNDLWKERDTMCGHHMQCHWKSMNLVLYLGKTEVTSSVAKKRERKTKYNYITGIEEGWVKHLGLRIFTWFLIFPPL